MAALVALGVAAFGGVVGWVWSEVAPRLQVIKAGEGLLYADAEPEQPIAADGWFFLLGLGLGIVLAVLAWVLLRRYRGAAMLAGLTVGSLVGAMLRALGRLQDLRTASSARSPRRPRSAPSWRPDHVAHLRSQRRQAQR